MKTVNFKFIIELPDGENIESGECEYEYNDEDKNDECDTYHYDMMMEEMGRDKINWVFEVLSIRHEQV